MSDLVIGGPETQDWQAIAEHQIAVSIALPIACEILSATACMRTKGFIGIADDLGYGTESLAVELAYQAWNIASRALKWVPGVHDWDLYFEVCAEAESLLQTGEYFLYPDTHRGVSHARP